MKLILISKTIMFCLHAAELALRYFRLQGALYFLNEIKYVDVKIFLPDDEAPANSLVIDSA